MSDDRASLDAVMTSTLVFEGNGAIAEYVGGYSDWVRQRPARAAVRDAEFQSLAKSIRKGADTSSSSGAAGHLYVPGPVGL